MKCSQRTAFNKYSSLLLTSALGIDLVVTRMGYPYIAQFISGMLVIFYLINFISLRRAVCSFWSAVVDIFFREISVGGLQKLEPLEDGRAVIFACAPHVNQFIDPLLVMKVVAEATGRHVSFMTAEKSFERNVVGAIMRAVKAIPVVRPDDLERKGAGFITCSGTHVQGYAGTSFSRDFVMGALLVVKTKEGKKTAKVVKVLDDANMELAEPGLKVTCPPPGHCLSRADLEGRKMPRGSSGPYGRVSACFRREIKSLSPAIQCPGPNLLAGEGSGAHHERHDQLRSCFVARLCACSPRRLLGTSPRLHPSSVPDLAQVCRQGPHANCVFLRGSASGNAFPLAGPSLISPPCLPHQQSRT